MTDKKILHDRIMLLQKKFREGKIFIKEGLKIEDSLLKVRFGSDGLVDPSTVDGLVRSLAFGVTAIEQREQAKQIPLREIQRQYFSLLEAFFKPMYLDMKKHNVTPYQIAENASRKPGLIKAFREEAPRFEEEIHRFWDALSPSVFAHMEDMRTMKTVFGGGIFPRYSKSSVRSLGIYFDSIILPDPMLRVSGFYKAMSIESSLFHLIEQSLTALSFKNLVLAECNPPVAVIVPDYFHITEAESYRDLLIASGKSDVLFHFEQMFRKKFKSEEELQLFLKKLNSFSAVEKAIKDKSKLLIDLEWVKKPLSDQWEAYQQETGSKFTLFGPAKGEQLKGIISGRLFQANDLMFKADRLDGTAIIEAPTSWQYFVWKYEYDRMRSSAAAGSKKIHAMKIARSLISDHPSNEMILIRNISDEQLIALRKNDALLKLRGILSQGIAEIRKFEPSNFNEGYEQIATNLKAAFEEYNKQVQDVKNLKRKFGLSVTSLAGVAAIEVAAVCYQNIPLSILGILAGKAINIPSAQNLWHDGKEMIAQSKKSKSSPVGIFINTKKC